MAKAATGFELGKGCAGNDLWPSDAPPVRALSAVWNELAKQQGRRKPMEPKEKRLTQSLCGEPFG
jgi:hypothetical protein